MRLEPFIALRYLFAGRQKSVVNVISWISLIGLTVSTAALIVVLSVYNGIGNLTKGLFGTFDPELVIVPAEGKTFHLSSELGVRSSELLSPTNSELRSPLFELDGIEAVAQMVDETAWLTYGSNQAIVRLRGVDSNYHRVTGFDTLVSSELGTRSSELLLPHPDNSELRTPNSELQGVHGSTPLLYVGGEIYYTLAMRPHSNLAAAVHIPKRGTTSMGFTMEQAFNTGYAYPAGYFFIQQDIDRQYVVTDIDFVRRLMNYAPDEVSALAVKLKPGANVKKVKRELTSALRTPNSELIVKDRYDQQPLYYKIFRSERLGIYLILSLIVLISTLSLVASLSLLVINKSRDIFILKSMGLTRQRLRGVFRAEGILICAVAVVAGLAAGFVVCFLQQRFGIIRMGDGNFVVSAFPVAMRAVDFLATFLLVMAISTASVTLTVHHAKI